MKLINKVINKEFWSREIIFYDFNSELNNSQNITLIFQLDKLSTNLNLKLSYWKMTIVLLIFKKKLH